MEARSQAKVLLIDELESEIDSLRAETGAVIEELVEAVKGLDEETEAMTKDALTLADKLSIEINDATDESNEILKIAEKDWLSVQTRMRLLAGVYEVRSAVKEMMLEEKEQLIYVRDMLADKKGKENGK